MTMQDVALSCVEHGWFVFPCVPGGKNPIIAKKDGGQGYLDATKDETQIRAWWKRWPDANVGVACGASDIAVVDADHGLTTEAEARAWFACAGLPVTYIVRTGRRVMKDGSGRPEFGVHLYYSGSIPGSGTFDIEGVRGEVQSIGDYVMGAGSVHPDSGEAYEVLIDVPVAPLPGWVKSLATTQQARDVASTVTDAEADGWKTWLLEYMVHAHVAPRDFEKRIANGWWMGIECPWSDEHGSGDGADSSTVLGILDGKLAFECSHGTCKAKKRDTAAYKATVLQAFGVFQDEPGADPMAVLGSGANLVELDTDEFESIENTARPIYPDSVWDDAHRPAKLV